MNASELLWATEGRVQQAEVFGVEGESTLVSFEANALKSVEVEETNGLALRAIVEGRLGFAAATGRPDPQDMLDNLLASAHVGESITFAFPGAAPAPPLLTFDPSLAQASTARLIEIGREIIHALTAIDPHASVHVDLQKSVERVTLRNTAGAEIEEDFGSFTLGVSVERVRGRDVLILDDEYESLVIDEAYRQVIERLGQHLRLARRGARLRSGRMPVLFSPAATAVLTLPILLGIDGKNVQQHASPLAGRLGEQVFDHRLTLWDDPTLAGRPSSSRYDDEGVPCRRKALIDHGVLRTWLLDLRTAALLGVSSTGNGAREIFSTPAPEPSCLVLEGGGVPVEEIIAGINHGLLVEEVLGLGQGNEISGAFSNALGLAYLIERGELVGRVKDVSIAGNVYDLLTHVEALSRERTWVDGNNLMPYVLLPELSVVTG